jgi:predicted S18 family serine protease
MRNEEVIEQTLLSYELANEALLKAWDRLDASEIDGILEKQQHRLEQIAERAYADEKYYDARSEAFFNTIERFEEANRHLYEHWDRIPFDQRLDLLQKQWNRLQELRNRIVH